VAKKRRLSITDGELAVLKVLWAEGSSTAKAITQALYPDCRESEYAAVHSFLQKLEKKGLVGRDRSAFVHVFTAAASQDDVAGQELEALADRLSDGAMAPFLTHLVGRKRLGKKEAEEIRRLLKKHFG
jgi:predicted transcriptional regulator